MPTTRLGDGPARWEYKVSVMEVGGLFGPRVDGDALAAYLNEAGDEGWELVAMVDLNAGQGMTRGLLLTLKRRG
ncbi:MAG TPA: DUF4177 domain-containing protein [Chloroflexaceae bacterium]|nr:DUF4177 domain-containing protein [Chloroflexaceae bacterium]